LDDVLYIKVKRASRNEFTVAYHQRLFQVEDSIRASEVMVYEGPDGSIRLKHKGHRLKIQEIGACWQRGESRFGPTPRRGMFLRKDTLIETSSLEKVNPSTD